MSKSLRSMSESRLLGECVRVCVRVCVCACVCLFVRREGVVLILPHHRSFTSNQKHAEQQVKFREDGSIERAYSGPDQPPPAFDGSEAEIVRGVSGEAVAILQKPDRAKIKKDLQYQADVNFLPFVLFHSSWK